MNLDRVIWLHVAEAAGLGLGVALLLRLLARFKLAARVRGSALLAALAAGAAIVLRDSGVPGETPLVNIAVAASVVLTANVGLRLLEWFVRERHPAFPRLLIDLFNFAVLAAIALVLLRGLFGVELNTLLITSTVVSAVIGLALQDVLGSVAAGLALQVEQPFRVGDWVKVGGQEGRVTQMNWRTLTLLTRDRHLHIVPNASVAAQEIVNYSRPTPLQRLHVHVGVGYQHPPGKVKDVLASTVAETEGVAPEPPPEVLVRSYDESAVQYEVYCWITDFSRVAQVQDAVLTRIWYGLRRAGMSIPFPQRDVTLRTLPEDHETRARAQLWREIAADLRRIPVFAPLTEAQIETLAHGADLKSFTRGEALVRQSETGDSLLIIKSGRVRVKIRGGDGQVVPLSALGPEEFFGEMSLLTGEPRSASVTAETETEVIEVGKAAFGELLGADSHLLEAMSKTVEARLRRTQARGDGDGALMEGRLPQPAPLLDRIWAFFGIKA